MRSWTGGAAREMFLVDQGERLTVFEGETVIITGDVDVGREVEFFVTWERSHQGASCSSPKVGGSVVAGTVAASRTNR